jgi:retron-type reverse transcriptase
MQDAAGTGFRCPFSFQVETMLAVEFLATLIIAVAVVLVAFGFVMSLALQGRGADWKYRHHWKRARWGQGLGIDELARRFGVSVDDLRHADVSYFEHFIPKRSGGSRRLLIPNPELKRLQRLILHRLLKGLRTHSAVTGFETGLSIVENALPHVGQAVVVKLDVSDFFPNTRAERVDAYFRRVGWDAECAALLTRLTTYEDGLPQGAPTSPRLSNLVNYRLDWTIERFVSQRRRGTYTRYADDITISFPRDYPKRVRGVVQFVAKRLKREGYSLNRSKIRILRQHQQQRVTGLVVNDRVNVPRRIRRKLRAVEHRLDRGQRATLTREQLEGWKAVLRMVEERRNE